MRTRTWSALLGATLVMAGMTSLVVSAGLPAQAAIPTGRLYFHSAAGGYRADVQADPAAANEDRNPKGSTTDDKPPTKTADSLATSVEPAVFAGAANLPTFSFAVTGTVTNICIDAWFQGRAPINELIVRTLINTPPAFVEFPDIVKKPYDGTLTRVTAMATYTKPADIPANSEFIFQGHADVNPDLTMVYDSVAHPSNITVNATSCTPVAVAAAPPAATSAPSASASAAPSASASAAPSASASASAAPSASASAAPSASTSGAPSGSASPSAAATPNCPTSSASAAPSSASAAPSGSASAVASTTASAVASSTASAPAASSSPPSGGGGVSSEASCRAASVTLATNTTAVTAGNSPTLSGVVRDSRGDAIEGATVTIFTKGYGETRYTAAATMLTDAAGQYKITVRPLKQTAYGVNVGNAKSPVLNIRVSTRVNIASPAPGTVGNPVTFSGTLSPGYARVAVGLGYLTNGRFVVLKQADTNGSGGYTITTTLPRGTFAFVIFTSAHQGTDKGSKSVRLTVR